MLVGVDRITRCTFIAQVGPGPGRAGQVAAVALDRADVDLVVAIRRRREIPVVPRLPCVHARGQRHALQVPEHGGRCKL